MRKSFLPIIAVLACMLGACSDEIDYTLSNEAVINGFYLGQIKRTMHTTNANGEDSTYTINYAGSYYPMTIDQINNKIYNRDSLPYGSHPESILASITSVGSVAYCIAGEAEPEWKIYSSSDSIDFTYLLKFRVMSNDGKAYREYEVKLNVHQQDGEKFVWQKIDENAPFDNMTQTKAIFWKDRIFVLGKKEGVVYATSRQNDQWIQTETAGCDLADISSLTVLDQTLYLNTTAGNVLTSTDGIHWETVPSDTRITRLVAGGASKLFATSDAGFVYSADQGKTWSLDLMDSPAAFLPTQDIAGVYYNQDNGNQRMLLIGNRNPDVFAEDTTAVVWSKLFLQNSTENHSWMYYPQTGDNPYLFPNLSNLTLLPYNNSLIAFGEKPVSGKDQVAYNRLYLSQDNGITWKEDDEIVMPYAVKGSTESVTATVDNEQFIWLINGAEIWRGRLNELGFN